MNSKQLAVPLCFSARNHAWTQLFRFWCQQELEVVSVYFQPCTKLRRLSFRAKIVQHFLIIQNGIHLLVYHCFSQSHLHLVRPSFCWFIEESLHDISSVIIFLVLNELFDVHLSASKYLHKNCLGFFPSFVQWYFQVPSTYHHILFLLAHISRINIYRNSTAP